MTADYSPPGSWKRQAAIFAAAASAITGIGVLAVIYFSAKEVRPAQKSPVATPAVHATGR